MINRFPIACALGYKWALKRGFDNELAKCIGYAISLAPNIARNGSKAGIPYETTKGFVGQKGFIKATAEDNLLENGLKLGKDFDTITFGRWDFTINFKNKEITMSRLRKPQWWNEWKYHISVEMKLTKEELKRLYSLIDQEFKDLSADEINYKYSKSYKAWWQDLMDRLRNQL